MLDDSYRVIETQTLQLYPTVVQKIKRKPTVSRTRGVCKIKAVTSHIETQTAALVRSHSLEAINIESRDILESYSGQT